jgi:hypothetical protein
MDETTDPRFNSVNADHMVMTYNAISATSGKIANGADFPSGLAYGLTVADNPDFDFSARSFTIAGWINLHNLHPKNSCLLSSMDIGMWEYGIYWAEAASNFQALLSNNGTSITHTLVLPDTIAANTWYFLALSVNIVTHQISLSLNAGTPVTMAFTGTVPHTTAPIFTGLIQFSGTNALSDCIVDELGIFDLLTPAEITTLYGPGPGNGLTYPF